MRDHDGLDEVITMPGMRTIFSDFLDLPLSDITAARVDRWRSNRRNRRQNGSHAAPSRVSGSTMNRDLAALQAALSRAVEWGHLPANPIKRMKRSTEDETAVVRYLSPEKAATVGLGSP
jgi:hypothetical protein